MPPRLDTGEPPRLDVSRIPADQPLSSDDEDSLSKVSIDFFRLFLTCYGDDLYHACTLEVSVAITPHWKVLRG